MAGPSTRSSLLIRLRDRRNDGAWSEFVDIYSPLVYRYCRKRRLQDDDAVDVVQEVLTSVASAIGKFEYDRGRGLFRSWLFTVTRNKLNNFFERQKRHPAATGRSSIHEMIASQPAAAEDQHRW